MNSTEDFVKKLNDAQELMVKEDFGEAIVILEKLKELDKKGDFNYNLSHRLYQLLSNSHSLHNQQKILHVINDIMKSKASITFTELNQCLEKSEGLTLIESELRKEVELLVLRGKLTYKISGNELIL